MILIIKSLTFGHFYFSIFQLSLLLTMKKIIVSITLLCYLAVTCGIIINFHYCMNRFTSVQFFVTENKTCPRCGMHIIKSHGCCRDEVKIIKMKVDQKTASDISFELPALDVMGHFPSQFIVTSFFNVEETRHYKNHSPPLLSEQDTYLQNGVFRI
jgi:hypothetical protein